MPKCDVCEQVYEARAKNVCGCVAARREIVRGYTAAWRRNPSKKSQQKAAIRALESALRFVKKITV